MANQQNYASDVSRLAESYNKYTVSRIIANKRDNLLDMEVPAYFSDNITHNNTSIEINLYSLADNSLIFSDVIKNVSGSIYTQQLQYDDNSLRTLLFVDFSRVGLVDIPTGQYTVTLNFFRDELGSYDDRTLNVSRISTSRTEVELSLADTTLHQKLARFATPAIPTEYIETVLRQIFNQEIPSNAVVPPTSPVRITSANLYSNFESGSGERLVEYGFDIDDENRIGINTIAQNVLNAAYRIAGRNVRNTIVASGSIGFTEDQLITYVVDAIDEAYDAALADEQQHPQRYRFDLL